MDGGGGVSTERRVDRGDFVEVWEGEPTWDNPSVWSSYRVEHKPGTETYIVQTNERTIVERAVAALDTNAAIVSGADAYLASPISFAALAMKPVCTQPSCTYRPSEHG